MMREPRWWCVPHRQETLTRARSWSRTAMTRPQAKVDKGLYLTLQEFMADIELMVNNARLFNEDGSEVFEDANRIWVRVLRVRAYCTW